MSGQRAGWLLLAVLATITVCHALQQQLPELIQDYNQRVPPRCSAAGAATRVRPLETLRNWQQQISHLSGSASPFIINIGAGDGVGLGDPCSYWLTKPDAAGLAIDVPGSSHLQQKLVQNYASLGVVKNWTYLSPDNVGAFLASASTPTAPFVYKIDIDSYDLDITQKVLELGYRPKFIYVEHAYNFPPGFWFKVRYDASRPWVGWSSRDHVFGNSASAWHELLGWRYGTEYTLLGVLGNNMLFGHKTVVQLPKLMRDTKKADRVANGWQPSLQCAYEQGFLHYSAWRGVDTLNIADVKWWTWDAIPREQRLQGMIDHVQFSYTMKRAGAMHRRRNLQRKQLGEPLQAPGAYPLPAPGGPPVALSRVVSLPYPVELRLDDNSLPLRGACAIDSCAPERVAFAVAPP